MTVLSTLLKIGWNSLQHIPSTPSQKPGASSSAHRTRSGAGNFFRSRVDFSTLLAQTQKPIQEQPLAAAVPSQPSQRDQWVEYTVKRGDTLWDLAVNRFHVHVEDIAKENGIEDPRKLPVGQKLRIHLPSYAGQQEVVASWYGREHHGKPMANAKPFDMYGQTIAHKELPLGTLVELMNKETGKKVRAVVTDRGPYVQGRDVDLSYGLARKLSLDEKGVGKLVMKVLG